MPRYVTTRRVARIVDKAANWSGGDRKAQAKGIREAHGLHGSLFEQATLIRSSLALDACLKVGGGAAGVPSLLRLCSMPLAGSTARKRA